MFVYNAKKERLSYRNSFTDRINVKNVAKLIIISYL